MSVTQKYRGGFRWVFWLIGEPSRKSPPICSSTRVFFFLVKPYFDWTIIHRLGLGMKLHILLYKNVHLVYFLEYKISLSRDWKCVNFILFENVRINLDVHTLVHIFFFDDLKNLYTCMIPHFSRFRISNEKYSLLVGLGLGFLKITIERHYIFINFMNQK